MSDNASTDETREIVLSRAATDPRLRYIRQERNIGPQENWRAVLKEARGKYFIWHADDDRYDATFVEKTVAHMENHPATVLCFSDYRFVDEEGNDHGVWRLPHLYPDADWKNGRRDFFRYPYTLGTVAIYGLYRTETVQQVGHPKPVTFRRLVSGLEAPFLAETARKGRITVLPEILFNYNNHALAKQSLAHTMSSNLQLWEKAILYATIEFRLVCKGLRTPTTIDQRFRLAGATLGAALRKVAKRPPPRPPVPANP